MKCLMVAGAYQMLKQLLLPEDLAASKPMHPAVDASIMSTPRLWHEQLQASPFFIRG